MNNCVILRIIWQYVNNCVMLMILNNLNKLGHLSMIFDAKWQNFCVRKIPMPMLV